MNNIIRRSWNMYSMVNIEDLRGSAFQDEVKGHTFQISGTDGNGNNVPLSGSVSAVFMRADNTDVAIVGSVSGGDVFVTLPEECYDMPGRFGLTIYLTSDGQTVAIYAAIGTIHRASSGNVSPETGESIEDLIDAIEAAIATIPADYSALWTSLAPTFNASKAYNAGEYVTYNGLVYRFNVDHYGSWAAADATAVNIGAELTPVRSAYREVLLPGKTAENSPLRSVLWLYFDFASASDENSFWSGTHTYSGTTYSRNLGVAIISPSSSISFYWFKDNNHFIAGNSAFTLSATDQIIMSFNDIMVYKKPVTLDGFSVTVYAAIDWAKTTGASGTYDGYYDKANLYYHKAFFTMLMGLNGQKSNQYPFIKRVAGASFDDNDLKAIPGLYIQFASESDENTFWSSSHTYGNVTASSTNIGLNVIDNTNGAVGFYYLKDDYTFISGDKAFELKKYDYAIYSSGSISVYKKAATLGSYNCTIYAIVDWDKVALLTTAATNNTYYNKENRSYQKFLINSFLSLIDGKIEYYPFIPSAVDVTSAQRECIKMVTAFCIQFEDGDDEAAFWAGNHTGTQYRRNIGLNIASSSEVSFYWQNDKGQFIAGDRAFRFFASDVPASSSGDVKLYRKNATLDGYSVKVCAIIDWGKAPSSEQVLQSFYDTRNIPHGKNVFAAAFSGSAFSRFADKNFGVDGDSITAGNQWSYFVYQKLGFNTHHNVGVGSAQWQDEIIEYDGTTYYPQIYGESGWLGMSDGWGEITSAEEAQKRANNSAKNHVLKFIAEVDNGDYPAPDLFVFALGTNDDPERLGTVEAAFASAQLPNVDDTLLRTTTGAMRWCIQKIHEEYPACKICWSSPIHSSTDSRENANITKVPVMTEVANKLSVQIIDQWNNSGISTLMEKAEPYFLRDGTHPTDAGVKAMGNYACSVISTFFFES